MADTANATAASKSPKTKSKVKKPKSPAVHPKYLEMSVAAITALKERNGSSRQAILKYIMSHYTVGKDNKVVNTHLKMALKRGVNSGILKHAKGQGASGSFRVSGDKKEPGRPPKTKRAVTEKPKKVDKPRKPKAKAVKSPEKKKVAKPKKAKKPVAKKPAVEKKKVVVKPKAKTAKKRTAKPKKAKSPKKMKK